MGIQSTLLIFAGKCSEMFSSHFDLWNSLQICTSIGWCLKLDRGSAVGTDEKPPVRVSEGCSSAVVGTTSQWAKQSDLWSPLSSVISYIHLYTRYCLNIQNAWFSHHFFRHFSFWGPYWILINLINYIRMIRNRQAIRLESGFDRDENKYCRSTMKHPSPSILLLHMNCFSLFHWLAWPSAIPKQTIRCFEESDHPSGEVGQSVEADMGPLFCMIRVCCVCAQKFPIVFN